jgi:hypothetical protein
MSDDRPPLAEARVTVRASEPAPQVPEIISGGSAPGQIAAADINSILRNAVIFAGSAFLTYLLQHFVPSISDANMQLAVAAGLSVIIKFLDRLLTDTRPDAIITRIKKPLAGSLPTAGMLGLGFLSGAGAHAIVVAPKPANKQTKSDQPAEALPAVSREFKP